MATVRSINYDKDAEHDILTSAIGVRVVQVDKAVWALIGATADAKLLGHEPRVRFTSHMEDTTPGIGHKMAYRWRVHQSLPLGDRPQIGIRIGDEGVLTRQADGSLAFSKVERKNGIVVLDVILSAEGISVASTGPYKERLRDIFIRKLEQECDVNMGRIMASLARQTD